MNQRFFISLFFQLILGICSIECFGQVPSELSPSQLVLPNKASRINFKWLEDSRNGKTERYAALLMPVQVTGCKKVFYMQFDLGSPYSMFYGNKIAAIRAKYPKTFVTTDSGSIKDFQLKLDNVPVLANEIAVKKFGDSKIDWSERSIEIIGTIGSDLIEDKIVVFNFPEKFIEICTQAPKAMASIPMSDFYFARRSVLLPATIGGKKSLLFYDSGSSAYELLTDKQTFEQLSVAGAPVRLAEVSSWGRIMTSHTAETNDSLEFGNKSLPIQHVTYMEGATETQVQQMKKLGIGGMIGNRLFLHSILILDTKNKKFGLQDVKSSQ